MKENKSKPVILKELRVSFGKSQGFPDKALRAALKGVKLARALQDKTELIDFLNFSGESYSSLSQYKKAIACHEEALKLSVKVKDKQRQANSYAFLAVPYRRMSLQEKAIGYSTESIRLAKELGSVNLAARNLIVLGSTYADRGEYAIAFEQFKNCLAIVEDVKDLRRLLAPCLLNMGIVLTHMEQIKTSKRYVLRAMKVYQQLHDLQRVTNCLNELGKIAFLSKRYDEALKHYHQGAAISVQLKDKHTESTFLNNIGMALLERSDWDGALGYLQRAYALDKKLGNKVGVAGALINIGSALSKKGKSAAAISSIKKGLTVARSADYKDYVKNAHRNLSDIYAGTRRFREAYLSLSEFLKVKDFLVNEANSKAISEMQVKYETDRKEKEKEIFRLKNVELKSKNRIIREEKKKSDVLLLNILPSEVAEELKAKGSAEAKLFDDVTVLFSDFKDFTVVSERLSPEELVAELNVCFKAFDEIMGKYGIEKIKTVGDAYMAAAGLPKNSPWHAEEAVVAALEMQDFISRRHRELGDRTFQMRVGLHSGKVVAGIVGVKKFAYDIWGDTVNTAARMEQNGEPGKVNISEATYGLVKDKFKCKYRGEIEAKNKGKMKMYFVEKK